MTDFRVSETYRKDTHHPAGYGYGRWTASGAWSGERLLRPSSAIVHTTNNINKGTKIWNEATFIRDSPDVSCHDLIAKDGSIYVILPPNMQAWHAGVALKNFTNPYSLGFEIHCSVGETPTQAQKDALAWRLQQYIGPYDLQAADIDTHRAVALPKGRKTDPEGWTDAQFYAWRDALFVPDYVAEWGTAAPYRPAFAIPVAWRNAYRFGESLGKALADELPISGGVMQPFEHGYITWNAATGTKVGRWDE